jgi:hypothetical protein
MRPILLALAFALLAWATPVSAAFECAAGAPYSALRADFEREFEAIRAADGLRQDEHRRALDGMIAEIDAKRGWGEAGKVEFLTTLMQSPEFLEQEAVKRDLAQRVSAALDAMERGEGDACAHARETLSLFVQGLDANEKQWSHMRRTIGAKVDAKTEAAAPR